MKFAPLAQGPSHGLTIDTDRGLIGLTQDAPGYLGDLDSLVRAGHDVSGYSVYNDGSIRDQRHTSQRAIGKNFDNIDAFGPAFVIAGGIPSEPVGPSITCRLNGKPVQSANTDNLIFVVARLTSMLREPITRTLGDLIVAGTREGVGSARTAPLWMTPGEVCDVKIEGVGQLRNPIAHKPD